jgi:glycosyltransferase involved in cell wall biosynthesis
LRPLARAEALSALGLSQADIHVAFLGTLQWWQGVETLIRAFAVARRQCPNLRLLIGGTGPQRDQLRQIADALGVAPYTRFLGHISFDRRQVMLSVIDIACFPATAERNLAQGVSPLKIRDYAAAGRAILSARLPGLEDLERADAAVLHRPDDVDDLAAKMVALATVADARERLGERAREFALTHYSWSEVVKAIATAVHMRIS